MKSPPTIRTDLRNSAHSRMRKRLQQEGLRPADDAGIALSAAFRSGAGPAITWDEAVDALLVKGRSLRELTNRHAPEASALDKSIRAQERALNAELCALHRNYNPDATKAYAGWGTALRYNGDPDDRRLCFVSIRVSRDAEQMALLKAAGYVTYVKQVAGERTTTRGEEAEFALLLWNYGQRSPNGASSWHAVRGQSDKPVFDRSSCGEYDRAVTEEALDEDDSDGEDNE